MNLYGINRNDIIQRRTKRSGRLAVRLPRLTAIERSLVATLFTALFNVTLISRISTAPYAHDSNDSPGYYIDVNF